MVRLDTYHIGLSCTTTNISGHICKKKSLKQSPLIRDKVAARILYCHLGSRDYPDILLGGKKV